MEMIRQELIDFLNEIMDCNEVPIRLRHVAIGLKSSINSAHGEAPSVHENESKKEFFDQNIPEIQFVNGLNELTTKVRKPHKKRF